jgi:hypothetical protein
MIKEGLRKTGINGNLSEADELVVTYRLLSRLVCCCPDVWEEGGSVIVLEDC